jgi:prolyl-tRNA synthetase
MTRNQEIANTILSQFGGHKFVVMTGAKNFVAIENGIRFNIGRNGSKANMVKVILDGDDTYTMQFVKKGREVNVCNIIMKYADKGMSETDFNAAVEVAINRANKSAEDKVLKECSGLYFHQLQATFTEYTKMYTRI